jgi:hypothetical protein
MIEIAPRFVLWSLVWLWAFVALPMRSLAAIQEVRPDSGWYCGTCDADSDCTQAVCGGTDSPAYICSSGQCYYQFSLEHDNQTFNFHRPCPTLDPCPPQRYEGDAATPQSSSEISSTIIKVVTSFMVVVALALRM